MREILFRGKRSDNGEWVYGFYAFKGKAYKRQEHHCICVSTLASDCGFSYFVDLEVIPETVGQYAGLTDKNGKKIFEGDIVKTECDLYHGENKKERVTRIGTVIYDKKFCQFGINVAGFSKCYVLNRWKGDYNEVIGNIHDNPELLKGGAE